LNQQYLNHLKQQVRIWRTGALPGFAVIGCVVIARFCGALQVLELMAFDQILRSRPVESIESQILIVGINEADIKTVGQYPIPDQTLATLLQILQLDQPRAIGLDIFRDLTTGASRTELAQILTHSPNLIGIEAAVSPNPTLTVKPPPELPAERIGMADVVIDADGKLRRSLLASKVDGKTRYSFTLLLAALYLRSQGMPLSHGSRASEPIQLGAMTLPQVRPNTGGYVKAKAGGNQILLNFRAAPQPFTVVSLTDVLTRKVPSHLIRDRIVIIGMTAASVNDTFMTAAVKGTLLSNNLADPDQYQLLYGVEYQAHATSQIINAALNHRPLLRSWFEGWEYVWILSWGLGGIALGLMLQSPWKTLLSLAIGSTSLTFIGYGLMTIGWWIPLVPTLMTLCAAGLTTSFFDRDSRVLLEQRSLILRRTYDAVHNGPLQTLAAILRNLDESPLRSQLELVSQELRSVYESMKQELLSGESHCIQTPLPELLYQIYEETLQRDLPGFASIEVYIPPNFDSLKDCRLTPEQKQGLCLFLQEALCNVGKHAIAANRLDVVCTHLQNKLGQNKLGQNKLGQNKLGQNKLGQDEWNLKILDDGVQSMPLNHPHCGRGTDQARELARSLNGKFERQSRSPQGIACQLTWSAPKSWRSRS
jgi:CHASE2 domain-containing sensor protein/two-component sensor histidine kinase